MLSEVLQTVENHPSTDTPYDQDPDVILYMDFQKGNTASFETLMHKYYGRIFNFLGRMTGNRDTAEDLTQEVFVRVYKAVSSYQPQSKFQTWIYTIAKNLALNELRRSKRSVVSLDAPVDGGDGEMVRQVADPRSPSPASGLLIEEKQRIIREAVESLPENQRVVVLLRRYDNLSYAEIANAMGCTVEAVKSLLSRARVNLKERLMKHKDLLSR